MYFYNQPTCDACSKTHLTDFQFRTPLLLTEGALMVDRPLPATGAVAAGQTASGSATASPSVHVSASIGLLMYFNKMYRNMIPPRDPEEKVRTFMWTAY